MFDMIDSPGWRRYGLTALGVLSLHVGMIWALQNSLMAPVPELVVPVSLLTLPSDAPVQARPKAAPPVKDKDVVPAPVQAKAVTQAPVPPKSGTAKTSPTPQASSTPQVMAADASVPTVTSAATDSGANSALGSPAAGVVSSTTPTSASAPVPALQLPSSDADYLRNPKPVYPPLSKRLNEQGTVVHSVLIGADGRPVSARLVKSSGFDRLDKAAYEAVMQWRYVPGKRQGVPEAMTFNVPIKWVLE